MSEGVSEAPVTPSVPEAVAPPGVPHKVKALILDGLKPPVRAHDIPDVIEKLFGSVKVTDVTQLPKGGFLVKGIGLEVVLSSMKTLDEWKVVFLQHGVDIGASQVDAHMPGVGRKTLMNRFTNTIAFKRIPAGITAEQFLKEISSNLAKFGLGGDDEKAVTKCVEIHIPKFPREKTMLLTLSEQKWLSPFMSNIFTFSMDGLFTRRKGQLWISQPKLYCTKCFEAHKVKDCKSDLIRCRWCLGFKTADHQVSEDGKCLKEERARHCFKCNSDEHCSWQCKIDSGEQKEAFIHKRKSYMDVVLNRKPLASANCQRRVREPRKGYVQRNESLGLLKSMANVFVELLIESGLVDKEKKEALKNMACEAIRRAEIPQETESEQKRGDGEDSVVVGAEGVVNLKKRSLKEPIQTATSSKSKQAKKDKKNFTETPSDRSKRVCLKCGQRFAMQGIGTHAASCLGIEGIEYIHEHRSWNCNYVECGATLGSFDEAVEHSHSCECADVHMQ
jgi:hypothetical protein